MSAVNSIKLTESRLEEHLVTLIAVVPKYSQKDWLSSYDTLTTYVEMENKLTKLREGVTLVSPEERNVVENIFSEAISQWRKRKRVFKDVWDTITENSPKNPNEFKEELGLEYDEDIGVSLQAYTTLEPHGKKRPRG